MQVKSRAWVKNAAIVFLALMLVLTFFSNTIMNYSLPEVAGKYAQYGPIQTAIRGTGTVTANQSFEVVLEETRQIATVHVKAGETVEAGQLLFTLEESDSDELAGALKQLAELELALNRKLLQMQPADYDSENRDIAHAQEDLQALIDKRDGMGDKLLAVDAAKAAVKVASDAAKAAANRVRALEKEKASIEGDIANLGKDDSFYYEHLLTAEVKSLLEALDKAKAAQEEAQKAYDKALETLNNYEPSPGGSTADALMGQITAKKDQITDLMVQREAQKNVAIRAIEGDPESAAGGDLQDALDDYNDPLGGTTSLDELFAEAQRAGTTQATKLAITTYYNFNSTIAREQSELSNLQNDYKNAMDTTGGDLFYKQQVAAAKSKLDKAIEATKAAEKTYNDAFRLLTNEHKKKLSAKEDEIEAAKEAQELVDEALKEAQAALADAEVEAGGSEEQLNADIKAKQRAIEELIFNLSKKKDDDRVTQAIEGLDLEAERRVISEQEDLVKRLREKASGAEVTARYGGILTSVSCVAGDKVQAGNALCGIDVAGKGYTTTLSVTNEQAGKVQVGIIANVGNRWDNTVAELIAIRNDPESKGRKKILEFSVQGDYVTAGQQLEITVGEKNQEFQCVLPNSAIREDTDGTFILAAESKSTPLGTRYTAVRIDVTVLAKDAYNTAISRDNYNYEFIITTATKPVEAGQQVRLVD